MYLIRAEARALQAGKEAGALADLNALRDARINNYTPVILAGAALVEAIAVERRKELFAEGHRWFDLKRTTRTIDRGAGLECGAGTASCRLAPAAREWVWPVPQLEINSNPSMAGQQTQGYE